MNEENLTQIGFDVDLPGLETQLAEAEQRAQAALQRMGELQAGGELPTVQSSPAGAPPPAPPPPTPPIGAPGAPDSIAPDPIAPKTKPQAPDPDPVDPYAAAKAELEKIQSLSASAPDVAMAGLMGQGGLQHRVAKAALADPDNAEQWQELLQAIKEQTKATREQIRKADGDGGADGGAPAGILNFLKGNAIVGALGGVAGAAAQGDMVGAATQGLGSLLGFAFGGPLGAAAGGALGGMVGGGINQILGGASEAQQYSMLTADIAARFGDIENVDESLGLSNVKGMERSGYSIQETAQLVDMLRQSRVIDTVDAESKELVESIQALTRATGMNTEALVNQYSSYTTLGGEQSAEGYMAQMIAGAVTVGMRNNLQEYGELVGSARMQLVYRSGMGDEGDGALRAIQGTLASLMGNQSNTADLLRDNPMLAQQMLGTLLQDGAAQTYSFDSAAMQLAGIERGRTDEAYTDPEQQVENALTRYQYVFQQFLGSGGLDLLGMGSVEELQAATAQNPNFLQERVTSLNPNAEQAAALQDLINMLFSAQFGQMPTSQNVNLLNQLGTSYLQNGTLDPQAITADGQTVQELINEMNQTEGDKAREAADARHSEIMELLGRFAPLITNIDNATAEVVRILGRGFGVIDDMAQDMKPILDALNLLTGNQRQPQAGYVQNTGFSGEQTDPESLESVEDVVAAAIGTVESNPSDIESVVQAVEAGVGNVGSTDLSIDNSQTTNSSNIQNSELFNIHRSIFRPGDAVGLLSNPIPTIFNNILEGLRDDDDLQSFLAPGNTGDLPHDVFGDTPAGGVLATENYNTFQFAPGDLVTATQSRSSTSYENSSSPISLSFTQYFTVGSGDMAAIADAAKQGSRSGVDEFVENWEQGRVKPRNKPRIDERLY